MGEQHKHNTRDTFLEERGAAVHCMQLPFYVASHVSLLCTPQLHLHKPLGQKDNTISNRFTLQNIVFCLYRQHKGRHSATRGGHSTKPSNLFLTSQEDATGAHCSGEVGNCKPNS